MVAIITMNRYVILIATCLIGKARADPDSNEWAFNWYLDEPFQIDCQISSVNITGLNVTWQTPSGNLLENGFSNTAFAVDNGQLQIKVVKPELHGVYICRVYNESAMISRAIFGLNIHEQKYRMLFDKYRSNLIVAVISTAVFLVTLSTTCVVYNFRYETRNVRCNKNYDGKYIHADNQKEITETSKSDVLASVRSLEGKGAYENPSAFTQL